MSHIISRRGLTFIVLAFMISSLFAYVLPTTFLNTFSSKKEKTSNINTNTHPLTGFSDAVVVCGNDNSELHEIYLCGASAERLITTNISNVQTIIWSKLQPGSPSNGTTTCANTAINSIWDDLSTDTQFNVTEGGEYRVLVRYTDNSSTRYYFNVYANGLNPNPVVTNIDCGSLGSIKINNVPSSYEFSINNGATWQDSNIFTITSVSNYDVQIRRKNDTQGCVFKVDDIAVNNNAIDATATVIPITCNTDKGGIKVEIADASATYIFEISQGGSLINSSGPITDSTYTFTDLGSGTFDINVKLASVSACSWVATKEVPVFVNIQPEVLVTKNIDCSDGIITVTQTGGSAPYEYSLNNGAFVQFSGNNQTTISISTAGAYVIKVKDANSCEIETAPVTISNEPEIEYSLENEDVGCNATDDGSITVNITNNQGYSLTYSIDGGTNFQTSNVFSNLSANTYAIIIRKQKAGGVCDLPQSSVEIKASAAFEATASITQQIDCDNGSAIVKTDISTGGTSPFEYSLDGTNFQTSQNFTGLGAGNYTITVKDANGCLTTVDQTVKAGSNPSELTFLNSNVNCATGATDVQVSVQNGTTPYKFSIVAPSNITIPGDTFTALEPNTYTFEVTTGNGCKIIRNHIVPKPIAFTSNVLIKNNISCATSGTSDGVVELSVSDFNTSFSVVVEDSSGTPLGLNLSNKTTSPILISGLSAETYTIKINDESGSCEKIETVTLTGPPSALTVDSFKVENINCGTPGAVTIETSGGWGNYRFSVRRHSDNYETPVQSHKTIAGLDVADTYTILVRDVNDCLEDTKTFTLIDQGGPVSTVDISATSPTNYCYTTDNRGVLKIDVSGGEAPYFYTLNSGTPVAITGGTFTLSNLTPDDYSIEVIGNNGCKTIVADTKISGQLFALADITKPYGCGTSPDAIIAVTPQKGYPPYTYYVNGNTTAVTMPFSASTEGSYTFEVVDSKGCTFTTQPVKIAAAPPLGFNHKVINTSCGKEGTGSVQLIGTGGTPPYQYAFSASPFSASNTPSYGNQAVFTNLDATTYYFAIKDELGCVIENEQALIGAEAAITAEIEKTDLQCDPVKGGNIWGNIKVKNILNSTDPVTISLIRVYDKAKYEAGDATRTWTYRRYENIDLATNSNYNNAYQPTHYGTNKGFDIRLYWAHHFVVRVEDTRSCFWESEVYTVDSPPIPSGVSTPTALQTCANGATYDFTISNIDSDNDGTPDLVGPFEVKLWPYKLIDDDGDGIEDDVNSGWRPFDDTENPLYDPSDPENERDYRFTNSTLYGKLLFGVSYYALIRDKNTGCVRWRGLRPIVQPPVGGITVDAVPQSETCSGAKDGEVQLIIKNYAPGDLSVNIYNASAPAHTAYHYGPGTVTGTGSPLTVTVPNMRVAWYVVEIEDSSGCQAGERFLIYRSRSKLQIKEDQVVQPTCNEGGQVAVSAIGGWDNERYYNYRNKIRQNWHAYEYALVLDSQTPTDADFGPNNFWTNIVPASYTGGQNVYRAYVRDGSGCTIGLPNAITLTKAEEPAISKVDVTDRCSSTTELYNVEATLSQLGTNPENTNPVYIWDGEVTTTKTVTLGPGHHTLKVRDENGCFDTQTIHIYPRMVPKIKITKTIDCDPVNPNGVIEASAYGGSGTYSFTLSPIPPAYSSGEEVNTTGVFDRLEAGISYQVTVTDIDPAVPSAERCPSEKTPAIILKAPEMPDYILGISEPVSCNGADDGRISVIQNPTADNLDVTYEFSLDGNPYQASNLFENIAPGLHFVRIRSSKQCIQIIKDINISEPTVLAFNGTPTVSDFLCTSDNNLGMAKVVVDMGGSGQMPYSYSYNGSSYTNLNTYEIPYLTTSRVITIDVMDKNNCPIQTTVTIPAAKKLEAEIVRVSADPMNCADSEVIDIIVVPNTGFSNDVSNYEIRELPSGDLINGTGTGSVDLGANNPGTFVYKITDLTTGCTDQVSHTILPFDTIEVSAAHEKNITCRGSSDGSLSFIASDFRSSGFDYQILNSDDTVQQATVNSNNSGSILISNLPAGTYKVRVTDSETHCFEESEHITIQSPAFDLNVDFKITQELTCDGADAQVTFTPSGGWGDYEYELLETVSGTTVQAFSQNNVINGLSGLSYQLRIKDSGGCILPAKEIVIPPIDPIVINDLTNVSTTNPSCPGSNDGTITVVVSRVNGPTDYSYILTNTSTGVSTLPQSSNTFSNLLAGTYDVTVQDNLKCADTTDTPIVLSDPAVLKIDAAITQEPSCTPNSGEITVSATGNLGDTFEYQMVKPLTHSDAGIWRPQANNIFSNLGPGIYEFIAKNQNNCETPISVIRTINVVEPLQVVIDDSNITINCFGESDAVLVASASGGLGGYQYQLEKNGALIGSPQDSGIFENLGAGTYDVRATSGSDCIALNSKKISITEPSQLLVPATVTANAVLCFGEETGSATIPVTGGVAPYSFYISTQPQKAYSESTFEDLAAGSYTVIVQDSNGCEKLTTFEVTGPSAPLTTSIVRILDEVCSSDDNGLIEISIAGGTSPYYYDLDGAGSFTKINGTTLILDNLDGGFYDIQIKDENDCKAEAIFEEVKVGADLTSTIETISECIDGKPQYSASVIFEDEALDTSEIVYDLDDSDPNNPDVDDAESSANFVNISAGDHTISIVHLGTGCIEVKSFTIEAQTPLTITVHDGEINQIIIKAEGGDGDYTYYFNETAQSEGIYYITETGVYKVRVVDGKGCEALIDVSMEFIDIEIPNFFTPDGDGYQDTWTIRNSGGFPDIYVRIYDRYGRTIKEWVSQGEWDGSYNKVDMPTGDYWYVLKLNGPNDKREFVGHFTVYR